MKKFIYFVEKTNEPTENRTQKKSDDDADSTQWVRAREFRGNSKRKFRERKREREREQIRRFTNSVEYISKYM